MIYLRRSYILFFFLFFSITTVAQTTGIDTARYKRIAAYPSLQNKSKFHKSLWGQNRRTEWATPVLVPITMLDTIYGGLKVDEIGGGNETRSLRLKSSKDKEYALRSIRKSRKDVVPPGSENTFVEDIIDDAISSSHPYGAFALPYMLEKAGIYHAEPKLIYVPRQKTLDTLNDRFGNDLYMIEQRPDGDWTEADNLGNFKEYSNTEDLIEKLLEENDHRPDQYTYIKARLFDMMIGDWDRHEDNWRWGKKESDETKIYVPVPRDRDQVFYTIQGFLSKQVVKAAALTYMQHFDHKVGNMKAFNWEQRYLDRFFTNELEFEDWMKAAKSLQESITDEVIIESVKGLPPEIYSVSGQELIEKLKSRREQLPDIVRDYYPFIAEEVEITGTEDREYFEVKRLDSGKLALSVYRIKKSGEKENKPYYQRNFIPSETKEIRLFGIKEEDIFMIEGSDKIITRVIGGPDKDSIVQTAGKVFIYDNKENSIQARSAKLRLSSDTDIHKFEYRGYTYDKKGIMPEIFYDYADRFYVGLGFGIKNYKWRKEPFANTHNFGVRYSISQNAFSAYYSALFPKLIKNIDLFIDANYDAIRWINFYGFGNETESINGIHYYRMHSREWTAGAGLRREFGKNTIKLGAFYLNAKIKTDTAIHASKFSSTADPELFKPYEYGNLKLSYSYVDINDTIVPTRGILAFGSGVYSNNFTDQDFFQNYSVMINGFLPLGKKFSLSIKAGGSTIVGNSNLQNNVQVFQHAVIGGPESLRGYRWERFWGKTAYYNNNELRFITNLKSYIMNAKAGLLVFFDNGRVWTSNDNSNTIHTSYGAGIILAPFNKIALIATYGISPEEKFVQLKINTRLGW